MNNNFTKWRKEMNKNFSAQNFEVITVTPQDAEAFLKAHGNYRELSPRRVASYSRLMTNGLWKLSQPIIFDTDGKLMDGQNRLSAVIKTGIPQDFIILCGVPKDSLVSIDNGQVRTAQQVMRQCREGGASGRIASTIRSVFEMPRKPLGILNSDMPILYDLIKNEIEMLNEWECSKSKGLCRSPFRAAIVRALILYPKEAFTLRTLVTEMSSGQFRNSLNGGLLMKFLLTSPHSGQVAASTVYLKSARAIMAEIEGLSIGKLIEPSADPFPLPESHKKLISNTVKITLDESHETV